jgi:hypothetical protein
MRAILVPGVALLGLLSGPLIAGATEAVEATEAAEDVADVEAPDSGAVQPPQARETDIEPNAPDATPALDLDRLLRPRGTPIVRQPSMHGDKNRQQWQEAFEQARLEVEVLESRIEVAQEKLREASSGEWLYAPAGGGAAVDPEVLKLRTELRRDRQSLEMARRRLRDLDVEASLAGVPEAWRARRESP